MARRFRVLLVVGLFAAATLLWPAPAADAQGGCYTYHGTMLWYYYGDWTCMFSGTACTECSQPQSDCYYDSGNDVSACDFFPDQRW